MKPKLKTMSIIGLLFLGANSAQAARETHGGHVVACKGKPAVTLDYYNASLRTISNLENDIKPPNLFDPESGDVFDFIKSRLKDDGALLDLFYSAYFTIGSIGSWISSPLEFVPDHGIPYPLPQNCQLLQAAVRQDEQTYGDPKVIKLLSEGQKELLHLHEALYYMVSKSGGESSTPVRELLRVLLNLDSNTRAIKKAIEVFRKSIALHLKHWECSTVCMFSTNGNVIFNGKGSTPFNAIENIKKECKKHKLWDESLTLCHQIDVNTNACILVPTPANSCIEVEGQE